MVMENQEMIMEKYFVKSVGTLLLVCLRIVFSFPL